MSSASRRRESRKGSGRSRLSLEALERRVLLSACAVFDNSGYVDTGGGIGDESDELQAALTNLGHDVSTFTGIDEAAFNTVAFTNQILVIPELIGDDLGAALNTAAKTEISSWVNTGGSLLINGVLSGNAATFLNTVFGFTLTEAAAAGGASAIDTGTPDGTAFEGGPATLADNNLVCYLDATTLPVGASTIYAAGPNESTVALIPYGAGQIVYLGYDWNDAIPAPGTQDGGWNSVLARSISELNLEADLFTTYSVRPSSTIGTDNTVLFEGEIVNNGPGPARNVTATIKVFGFGGFPQITGQSLALSVSESGGAITEFTGLTGPITVPGKVIGTFATDFIVPGGVMRFNFRVQTDQSGALHSTATATTDSPDPALANNTADFHLIVLPNIFVDDSGNLVIRDVASEGRDDNLTLAVSGGELVISDPGNTLTLGVGSGFGGVGQSAGTLPANSVNASLLGINRIIIETGLGNDSLAVDLSGGVIPVPISFDGGSQDDALQVIGTPPVAITGVTYTPGPGNGQGRLAYDAASGADLTIDFVNLEPVLDLVPAATLTVNGTNADNAINYAQGSVAANGLVSVDGFETIEFSNKTNLVINGLAGSDEINLHNSSTPTGLASITVNGDDGDDTLTSRSGVPVAVNMNGGAGNDLLDASGVSGGPNTLSGGDGNDTIIGGSGNDTMDGGAGDDTFSGNGGTDDIGGGVSNSIGDTLLLEGTQGDDTISTDLDGSGFLVATVNGVTTTWRNFIGGPFATSGIERILVEARDGTDTITVEPLANAAYVVFGGAPIGQLQQPAGDLLNVVAGGLSTTLLPGPEPDSGTLTVTGNQPVSFDEIEQLQLDGSDLPTNTRVLTLANGQVILYDSNAIVQQGAILTDVLRTDFRITVDAQNDVRRVDLVGNPTGLGIIINSNDGGPVAFRDARKGPTANIENLDFVFINSAAPSVYFRSPINGFDLSQILVEEGLDGGGLDLDGDGAVHDRTAFFSAGPATSFAIKDAFGDVAGDIVILGADPLGFAVQKFSLQNVDIAAGTDVVLPGGGINSFSQKGGAFDGDLQVTNILKGTFGGPLTGDITFLGDFTGRVATSGVFGGDVSVLGDFTGFLGGKKTPNGPSTLFLTSGQTFNGFVSRVPDGFLSITGEDLLFGGAFAVIDVV